ncbi:MAG: zinc-ribbon domain-containing protein [Pseudomonadota bacterium]
MRLICPNCDATYEVPDSVIPAEGREVQCSNCGNAWFFNPNFASHEPEVEPAPEPPTVPVPSPEPSPATMAEPERAEASDDLPDRADAAVDEDAEEAGTDAPVTAPRRRPLESTVADVLREEAEFEAKARAEEEALEYQDDLPLATPPSTPPATIDKEAVAAAVAGSRRDLLPDIDEINSTLRATSERKETDAPPLDEAVQAQRHRRGFRVGFGLACILLALMAGLYSYADMVAAQVPALEGVLAGYVDVLTGWRLWLQDSVARLAERIET